MKINTVNLMKKTTGVSVGLTVAIAFLMCTFEPRHYLNRTIVGAQFLLVNS